MTHEEIEAAIERLRRLPEKSVYTSTEIVNAIVDGPRACDFIDLLRQADPGTHMELPVDADGMPIHVGDKMDCGEHFGVQEVEGFIHGAVAFTVCDPQPARICTCPAHMTRHYHRPTVEGVLIEYAKKLLAWHNDCDPYDSADDELALVAYYADKIREVMADDQR